MGRQASKPRRAAHGTLARQRPPIRRIATRPAPPRDPAFTPASLLFELPTALLLAVFVGTGWLGYAQTSGTPAQPRPAVVVPVELPQPER
ncbi:hypothetical protein JK358_05940 [Nocardia sp. 2]|uniref:Uncharacterized protein n=1 Tax=Nocardia acididurans TaxID=2802282 RepID=A0ABS1M286_9NOCA|nr:hypothetical protein [Nocardia acididurans]MBL1073929.1 hypothetical protein [Nocardia acididurans]